MSISKDPSSREEEMKKLLKLLPQEEREAMMSMSPQELEAKVVEAEQAHRETEQQRAADPDLAELKARQKEVNDGYSHRLKMARAYQRFAVILLEERGKL